MDSKPRAQSTSPKHPNRLFWWPAFAFLLVLTVGAVFIGSQENDRRNLIRLETQVVADQVRYRLESSIESRLAVVLQFASEWQRTYAADAGLYARQASGLVERFPGMFTINWVDSSGIIRRTAPELGNEEALNKDLRSHPNSDVGRAFEEAQASGEVRRTHSSVQFFQGGRGFAFYVPVRNEAGEIAGYVNSAIDVGDLIEACLSEETLNHRFRFHLSEADGFLAYGDASGAGEPWPFETEREFMVLDRPWILRIAPSTIHLEERGPAVLVLLLAGVLVLATTLALLLRLFLQGHDQLRNSEAQVRLLLDSTGESIYGLDLDGKCTFCNSSCLEVLGYDSPTDLLGRNMHEMLHHGPGESSEHLERECALFERYREGRGIHEEIEALWRRDGSSFPAEVRSHPIFKDGRVQGAVVTFNDITRLRRSRRKHDELERQFQQAQKMESLGLLAGGVAHDFNNLLVGVLGNASLALEALPPDSALTPQLAAIATAAERASELTEQLLNYSGRQPVAVGEVNLIELVEEMARLLKASISKKVDLRLEMDEATEPVSGDPTQLRQVVMNLITNASDALGDEPGRVLVRTTMTTPPPELQDIRRREGCELLSTCCLLEVSDEGVGMSPATQQRIFDPFFTTKGHGRGLGLSAVMGIVAGHGGSLQVHSQEGRGTRVRIYLPPSGGVLHPAPTKKSQSFKTLRTGQLVLVVDDEEIVRDVVTKALEQAGFEVYGASTGEEGVELFGQHADRVEVIVMDMTMPGMNGVETSQEIWKLRPEVPIVLSSGRPEEVSARDLEGGFVLFLRKPFRSAALIDAVREALAARPVS